MKIARCLWVAVLCLLAGSLGACSEKKKNVNVGGGGAKVQSSHWDTGSVALDWWLSELLGNARKPVSGLPQAAAPAVRHPIDVHGVAGVGFGHEWGGSGIMEFLGGVRLVNESQFKYPIYGEVLAGWIHYSGFETVFTLRPSAGVYIPLKNTKYRLFVQGGLPFVFFDFFHEHGVEWRAGLSIPITPKKP